MLFCLVLKYELMPRCAATEPMNRTGQRHKSTPPKLCGARFVHLMCRRPLFSKISCVADGCSSPDREIHLSYCGGLAGTGPLAPRCAICCVERNHFFFTFPADTHHLRPPRGAKPYLSAQAKPSASSFAARAAVIPSLGSPRSIAFLRARCLSTHLPSGELRLTLQFPCLRS